MRGVDDILIQIIPPKEVDFLPELQRVYEFRLLAIANANYKFIYCDTGTNGGISDGGVIENTTIRNIS